MEPNYQDDEYEDSDEMDQYYEDDYENNGLSLLWEYCMIPTLNSVGMHIFHLLAACFLFRLSSQTVDIPMGCRHFSSTLFGLYALYHFFGYLVIHLVVLVFIAYIILFTLTHFKTKCGAMISTLSFAYLVGNEYFLLPEEWRKLRGPAMLVVMKVVSVAFDLDFGTIKKLPNIIEYNGYTLCVGTSVFGTWFSFQDYQNIYRNPVWNFSWLVRACRSVVLSIFTFLVSVCSLDWFVPHDASIWLSMYRDAMQFRTSHYFVCYLSEAAAIVSGFGCQADHSWDFTICEPMLIEFPYSLVQVVISWNKRMHLWLKKYVFQTSKQYGGLVAVLMTYAVSSLLHGINYPIAAVLMSLGMYTYVEHGLRLRLAALMDSCTAARPCLQPCNRHLYTPHLLSVASFNWLWSTLAVFHLAYLGCIVDTSDKLTPYPDVFEKWVEVNFISHYVCFLTYILYFCIK